MQTAAASCLASSLAGGKSRMSHQRRLVCSIHVGWSFQAG